MDGVTFGLIVVLLLILGAELVNGWTDAPNAIATVVSTRALPPVVALIMAALLNLVGVLSGTAVAKTIASGIVDKDVIDLTTVGGAMTGIIIWSTLAARLGLPTSETHALVSGLAGGGIAVAGPSVLLWEGWKKVLIGLCYSTFLGLLGGFFLMTGIYWLFRNAKPGSVRGMFRWLQVVSSGFMAFSHGMNDGQKFMGAFTLALFMAGVQKNMDIPLWVILLCAVVMGVGTMIGGWKIIHTMGTRMTPLKTHEGFAAETAAATTIVVASHYGIPLSTTHTIGTSIMGVGSARGIQAVRWRVAGEIVTAWIITFPICGAISFLTVKAAMLFR